MIRFLSICIFLCAPFFGSAQRLADSLFAAGSFASAQLEYERLVFEGRQPVGHWLLKKSYCQKAQLQYSAALETIKRADLYNGPDSLLGKLFYETALLHYLNQQPDLALSRIQEWRYLHAAEQTPALEAIEVLALADLERWPEARAAFAAWADKYQYRSHNPLQHVDELKWRKAKKAEALSFLLPGSGQWYAGSPGRGLVSTALTVTAVWFAIHQFTNGFFFSGAYTGVGLFYLFYWGGARYAVKLAEARNQKQKDALLAALRDAFKNASVDGKATEK
jgi:TM2 domain-containing membrane protein YozV